jgi:hypothetical protein
MASLKPRSKKGSSEAEKPTAANLEEAGQDTGGSREQLVRRLALLIEKKLKANEYKPTVADLIRLLEYEEAVGDHELKKVEVRWVDQKD